MRHYRYKLLDLIKESQQDFADAKQFYGGDSDTGEQAGKPGNADFNEKAIADAVSIGYKVYRDAVAAVRTVQKNTKATGDLNLDNLIDPKVEGEIKYKTTKLTGNIDVTGNLESEFQIKMGDPPKKFNAKLTGNVANIDDIYNNPLKLTFTDSKGKINDLEIQITPEDKYNFSYNKTFNILDDNNVKTGKMNFGIDLGVYNSNKKPDVGISSEFLSNKKQTYNAGISYSEKGTKVNLGFMKTADGNAAELINGRNGRMTFGANAFVNVKPGEKSEVGANLNVTFKTKKVKKDKIEKIGADVMNKVYDQSKDYKEKEKKEDLKENILKITRKELSVIIENMLRY